MKFQSNLREVMLFIKYSKNKEKLVEVLKNNQERFQQIERRAMDVIETITNTGFQYEESEVIVNMCEAIQEIRMEERNIGEEKKAQEVARNLYEMGDGIEKIAQVVGYTVETVKQWLNLLAE